MTDPATPARRTAASPPARSRGAVAAWVAVLVLVAAVLAAFLPVLENGFVNADDPANFLENRSFRGFGRAQLAWAWTTRLMGVYQPLSWMLIEAEYAALGLDPRGYHLASLSVYLLVVLALDALTIAVVARCRPDLERSHPGTVRACACLAVGLFAVHPLRVEVVAWASCQAQLVCSLFAVLSVLAYLRAHTAECGDGVSHHVHRGWRTGSFLLFAASLLAQGAALGLPLVLLILDVYPLQRLGRGRWLGLEALRVYREKVPFAALSAAFTLLAFWARVAVVGTFGGQGALERVSQACYAAWFYLVKTFAPVGIMANYPLPAHLPPGEPRFLFSILGVLAVTAVLLVLRRRCPAALAAWAIYLALLAPRSGLVRIGQYIAADRYSFLPLMSLAVLAAAVLCAVVRSGPYPRLASGVILVAGMVAGLALVLRTRDQCRTWRDSETLWSHALAASNHANPFACRALARLRADQPGKLAEAELLLAQALAMVPGDSDVHNELAEFLIRQGRFDEARSHLSAALRLAGDNVPARINLGNLLALQGDHAGAEVVYRRALELDPTNPTAHANYGVLLHLQGRPAAAGSHLREALRLNPDLEQARRALAALRREGARE